MRILTAVLVTTLALAAQEPERRSHFEVRLAFGGGQWEHDSEGAGPDDQTDAAFLRIDLEATSKGGFGGGLRFEGIGSDDDLFEGTGFATSEAQLSDLFLHFTYRVATERFEMPFRIGILLEGYQLRENVTDDEATYGSIGPYLELAPEFALIARRRLGWSIYGEVGVGAAGTGIDLDGDSNDYVSSTVMWGAEVGTRFRAGPAELGVAFVGRWRSMDESDEEDGFVVLGHDASFRGLVVSGGVVF